MMTGAKPPYAVHSTVLVPPRVPACPRPSSKATSPSSRHAANRPWLVSASVPTHGMSALLGPRRRRGEARMIEALARKIGRH